MLWYKNPRLELSLHLDEAEEETVETTGTTEAMELDELSVYVYSEHSDFNNSFIQQQVLLPTTTLSSNNYLN